MYLDDMTRSQFKNKIKLSPKVRFCNPAEDRHLQTKIEKEKVENIKNK